MNGALKKLVNDKQLWDAYVEYIDDKISSAHKRLEQENQPDNMYRVQGEIASLRRLKYMRDEINGSQ